MLLIAGIIFFITAVRVALEGTEQLPELITFYGQMILSCICLAGHSLEKAIERLKDE